VWRPLPSSPLALVVSHRCDVAARTQVLSRRSKIALTYASIPATSLYRMISLRAAEALLLLRTVFQTVPAAVSERIFYAQQTADVFRLISIHYTILEVVARGALSRSLRLMSEHRDQCASIRSGIVEVCIVSGSSFLVDTFEKSVQALWCHFFINHLGM